MYQYEELAKKMNKDIMKGKYGSGHRLPSIRQLSSVHGYSKSTVLKALEKLKTQGIIYVLPRSGYYVGKTRIHEETRKDDRIDFSVSIPDASLFPYQDFQRCINQAIDRNKAELFQYGTMKGYKPLIDSIVHQLRQEQIFASHENIVITGGIQEALSILCQMDFGNKGEKILIEQPTYHLMAEMVDHLNYPTVYIERDEVGYDFNRLEKIFKEENIKFFYLMPRVHNPLGTTLTHEDKQRLIFLSMKYKVYLVEDDYMGPYVMHVGEGPLYTYDSNFSQVIYLRSFSKIIFPGLRLGIAVLPKELIEAFMWRKIYNTIDSSMLSQASLEIYLKNGMYKRHSKKMRQLYHDKSSCFFRIMKEEEKNTQIIDKIIEGKYVHTCLILNQRIDFNYFQSKGIKLADIKKNYIRAFKPQVQYLPLNVSSLSLDTIEEAVKQLFKIL